MDTGLQQGWAQVFSKEGHRSSARYKGEVIGCRRLERSLDFLEDVRSSDFPEDVRSSDFPEDVRSSDFPEDV
ncbi:hypothetical protein L6452_17172 [Arctium lappa]|uniref:Uncharacterized protein n=1 Tax=Arctium lappa TaxID=4217 RepID=A0ACB9C2U1_ARCLA|nr:hypothetical protein L6452_17172 [Arctium lappa]